MVYLLILFLLLLLTIVLLLYYYHHSHRWLLFASASRILHELHLLRHPFFFPSSLYVFGCCGFCSRRKSSSLCSSSSFSSLCPSSSGFLSLPPLCSFSLFLLSSPPLLHSHPLLSSSPLSRLSRARGVGGTSSGPARGRADGRGGRGGGGGSLGSRPHCSSAVLPEFAAVRDGRSLRSPFRTDGVTGGRASCGEV